MDQFISIQSMQCTSHFGMDIDCELIATFPLQTKFDPSLPHKISVFLDDPKVRFTLFRRKGKIVILGGKSVSQAIIACQRIVEEVQMWSSVYNHPMEHVQYHPPIVNNIVTSGSLGRGMYLTQFAQDHDDDCIYESEQFPGLRLYHGVISKRNASIRSTLFASGKFLLTGFKQEDEINDAFNVLKKLATPYLIPSLVLSNQPL